MRALWRFSLPWVLVALLATSNASLLWKFRAVLLMRPPTPAQVSDVTPGVTLSGFELVSVDGQTALVRFPEERPLLILFFSPDCIYCWQDTPNWRKLASGMKGSNVRLLGIVRPGDRAEQVREMLSSAGLSGMTTAVGTVEVLRRLGLNGTPTTLLVSPSGIVRSIWHGRLPHDALATILMTIDAEARARDS